MIIAYYCGRHKDCHNNYGCGVDCEHTTDVAYAERPNPPKDFEDLENRFEFLETLVFDGKYETVWIERKEGFDA